MPTYDYVCQACNKTFEIEQRITADPLTMCEECGQPTLKRLISNTSFTLKGSGWFKDGYTSSKCSDCKGCNK